jgi:uncharacterized protein (UPF0332 family)
MDEIEWCLKKGMELIEPSENLKEAYLQKAEEALEVLRTTNVKDWKLATAYYAMYHGVYSMLMRIGVKCEIHKCTIEFARRYLPFTADDIALLGKAFRARNDSQYYVDRQVPDSDYELIVKKAPSFLVKCKNAVIVEKDVRRIRESISKLRA